MTTLPDEILAEADVLFDDVRRDDIDPLAHASFVIARVLERGTLRSVGAVLRTYGTDRLRRFFLEGGSSEVSPRTIALWKVYFGLSDNECTSRSSLPHKSPFWRN